MPYALKGNCVIRADTGEIIKCHPNKERAQKHLAALKINVEAVEKKEFYDSPEMMDIEYSLPKVSVDLSAWGIPSDEVNYTGTLRTLFNGKLHEAMTCITDQLTQRGVLSEAHNKVLTDLKGQTLRYFNENLPPDLSSVLIPYMDLRDIASKEVHEIGSQFISVKEANSPFDWAMITSSAYRDREGQIVSRKAHEQDIAYMEQTGNYGTLDWWHLHPVVFQYLESKEAVAKLPLHIREHGLIVGDCTFSQLYGNVRIEAGTYRSKEIGEAFIADAENLSASLLFFRPANEPDADGIYHNIHTVSRAIMPRDKVSNLAPYLSSAALMGMN